MGLNLRLIHHHCHPVLTVTSLSLRAVDPDGLRVVDLHHEFHGPESGAQRLKAGKEPAARERMAWFREAALHDGVVSGIVAEGEGVADVRGDDGGVELEAAVADGDGDVGGEAEG